MTALEMDELVYLQYPRKVGKTAALKAIAKAVKAIAKRNGGDATEARRFLYRKTKQYAESPAGRNPDRHLVPHPATWYNRGSFDDDPIEWQLGGRNAAIGKAAEREQRNRAASEQVLEWLGERHTSPHKGLGGSSVGHEPRSLGNGSGSLFGGSLKIVEG